MRAMSRILTSVLLLAFSLNAVAAGRVEVLENQLVIDGQKQPQLFGAEVQYFRLRGGYGPNLPRAKVLELWNKALDHLVGARMNAISFYIPWDFHEFAEGQFDFSGTADVDHDGREDYPSRDILTFFRLIAERGITRIMVRPGPYINAEWGFLGFGAIPKWFHEKYPDSHMRTTYGQLSRLYDYQNPDLLRHTQLWFKALLNQVLKERIGPGKPVVFLQIDNETNYQWQSLYSQDYGSSTISRYQDFLKFEYRDLNTLNASHGRQWERWNQIQPPTVPGRYIGEDQAWYRFADNTIFSFLSKIRDLWTQMGVLQPQVLFTLAESFNAPVNGLLPHFLHRNSPHTGLMTVNLYPKTFEGPHRPLLNFPFKADLDVKSADEANDLYFGSKQEWVMGPEIQGGWWKGIDVSPESRQQTYLTVLGHGLKAFFIYYFNEGENWDAEWMHDRVRPLFADLISERRLGDKAIGELPDDFWNELQAISDRRILVGIDVRRAMKLGPLHESELYFDAPLDGRAEPRSHYFHLKKIGERVIAPYQDFLAQSVAVYDEVAIVKDSTSHQPASDSNLPSAQASADWTGGLLGYLMNADLNPRVLHGDGSPESNFKEPKLLVHLDTGLNAERTLEQLKLALNRGQFILNFLASDLPRFLGIDGSPTLLFGRDGSTTPVPLEFHLNKAGQLRPAGELDTITYTMPSSKPLYSYKLPTGCEGILYSEDKIVGYRCKKENGTFVQIGALIFDGYNSSAYSELSGLAEQEVFLKALSQEAQIFPQLQISQEAERTVAFARTAPGQQLLWITIKTGTVAAQSLRLKVNSDLLHRTLQLDPTKSSAAQLIGVTDLLSGTTQKILSDELIQKGFQIHLKPNGSNVFVLKSLSP
jgi:hypothetical protein